MLKEFEAGFGLFQLPRIQFVLVPELEQKKLDMMVGTFEMPAPSVRIAEPLSDVLASKMHSEM